MTPDQATFDATVAAATAESKWTTFTASDGDLAIRMRTEAEQIEAMVRAAVAAAAPIIAAAERERCVVELRALAERRAGDGVGTTIAREVLRQAADAIARAGTSEVDQ